MEITAAELTERIAGKRLLRAVEGGERIVFEERTLQAQVGTMNLLIEEDDGSVTFVAFSERPAPIRIGLNVKHENPKPTLIQIFPNLHLKALVSV